MPIIKRSTTKNINKTINYNRSREGSLHSSNCVLDDKENVKKQMEIVRNMYGKTDRTQGHVIYLSWDEKDSEKIKKEGSYEKALYHACELAEEITKGEHLYDVTLHTNTNHIHAHIVINSVNTYNGEKFNCFDRGKPKEERSFMKWVKINDDLSRKNGYRIPPERGISKREIKINEVDYHIGKRNKEKLKELGIQPTLKDLSDKEYMARMIRVTINHSLTYEEFEKKLNEEGITINKRGSYVNQNGKAYRPKTLGSIFDRNSVERTISNNRTKDQLERTAVGMGRVAKKTAIKLGEIGNEALHYSSIPVKAVFRPVIERVEERKEEKERLEEIERNKRKNEIERPIREKLWRRQRDFIEGDLSKRCESLHSKYDLGHFNSNLSRGRRSIEYMATEYFKAQVDETIYEAEVRTRNPESYFREALKNLESAALEDLEEKEREVAIYRNHVRERNRERTISRDIDLER